MLLFTALYSFYFVELCVCFTCHVCVSHVCLVPLEVEEDTGFLGTGVADGCGHHVGAGNKLRSSAGASAFKLLSHCASSHSVFLS